MIRFRLKQLIADEEFRAGRHITFGEISEATGINRSTLSKMAHERGAVIRSDVIDRLCTYFKCRVEDLVEHLPDG